ncbi:MAG: response regulator transcription factor [Myxococcota bacterium]
MSDRDTRRPPPDEGPILVVDDDPALRRALSRILRHEGHEVIEASDGATAVDLSRAYEPSLMVLDYMMPGMDGEMVLETLRGDEGDAPPALLLTASGAQQERAAEIGAVQGLSKPFRVEDLLDAVEAYKRKREPDA